MNAALKERMEKINAVREEMSVSESLGMEGMEGKEITAVGAAGKNAADEKKASDKMDFENPYGNTSQGRALEYLGKGIKPGQVAAIIGVTPALISQFLEDPVFKELVEERKSVRALAVEKRNARLDALEDLAISQVEKSLQFMYKPSEALAALKVINGLERRSPRVDVNDEAANTSVVVLQLPQFMMNQVVQVQLSTSKEIVEVNGEEMRTMGSVNVGRMLKQYQDDKVNAELVEVKDEQQYASAIFE